MKKNEILHYKLKKEFKKFNGNIKNLKEETVILYTRTTS